jgi:hypothetical protein
LRNANQSLNATVTKSRFKSPPCTINGMEGVVFTGSKEQDVTNMSVTDLLAKDKVKNGEEVSGARSRAGSQGITVGKSPFSFLGRWDSNSGKMIWGKLENNFNIVEMVGIDAIPSNSQQKPHILKEPQTFLVGDADLRKRKERRCLGDADLKLDKMVEAGSQPRQQP